MSFFCFVLFCFVLFCFLELIVVNIDMDNVNLIVENKIEDFVCLMMMLRS